MSITLQELARLCGVSLATVDRALHDRPGIKPTTRERVIRLSRELDYRPNLAGRSLRIGRTYSVGIVVYDLDNEFFAKLVDAFVKTSKERGYFTSVAFSNHDPVEERDCLAGLASQNVDGIFIVPTGKEAGLLQLINTLEVPVIAIGNPISRRMSFVGPTDREAVKDAVRFIASRDYRRVVYVSPPLSYAGRQNIYEVSERLEGFRQGVDEVSLGSVVLAEKHFRDALLHTLRSSEERTAIMCSSDKYAIEALDYVGEDGLVVPKDVGLMGFDDIKVLEHIRPRLTTIAYPTDEIAGNSFDILEAAIADSSARPEWRQIRPKLVDRGSI